MKSSKKASQQAVGYRYMKIKYLQCGISVGALLIAATHITWPDLTIDAITVILIFIALVPWLAPLFKSLEFPGGWKIEFRDFERVRDKAYKVGLLSPHRKVAPDKMYSFQLVAEDDPKLALAGLRIEIEKRLNEIAESSGTEIKHAGIRRLMDVLRNQEQLTQEQHSVLADLIGLLNAAVHGGDIDDRAAEWALDVGPRLLDALEAKARK